MIEEIKDKQPAATAIEVWFQDEARVGQKGTLTRRWAPRGSRLRAIRDHRFKSAQKLFADGACQPVLVRMLL